MGHATRQPAVLIALLASLIGTSAFLSSSPALAAASEGPKDLLTVLSGPSSAHVGDAIAYRLAVSADGKAPVEDVSVSISACSAQPTFISGDTNSNGSIDGGETWQYGCDHIVSGSDPDPLVAVATAEGHVAGKTSSATSQTATDILHPAISLTVTVNPVSGEPGDEITHTYVVANVGDAELFDVRVESDLFGDIWSGSSLGVGAQMTFTKQAALTNPGFTDHATASGRDVLGKPVTDDGSAGVTVLIPGFTIQPGPTKVKGLRLARTGVEPVFPLAMGLALLALGFVMTRLFNLPRRS